MDFKRTNTKISLLEDFYTHFDEDKRLKTRHGQVEFITTTSYINKYLRQFRNPNIIDIGAGCGEYSIYYHNAGFNVTSVELVKHNIDILKRKCNCINTILANAMSLNMIESNSYDIVLLFGPMYHLMSKEDKLKALSEAKRVCKKDGLIFISYIMNEYAILTYGFIKGNIMDSLKDSIDNNYHVINKENDLYSYDRLEDIYEYSSSLNLKRVNIIASTGPANYIRTSLNKLTEEEFNEFIKYHLATCERSDLLGASSHILDILKKEE